MTAGWPVRLLMTLPVDLVKITWRCVLLVAGRRRASATFLRPTRPKKAAMPQ